MAPSLLLFIAHPGVKRREAETKSTVSKWIRDLVRDVYFSSGEEIPVRARFASLTVCLQVKRRLWKRSIRQMSGLEHALLSILHGR